jgi:hypothetical protein
MPWRGPEVPGEYPTLGYQVADWIEAHCAIPDRELVGDPFLLTDEQLRFLLQFYRVDPGTGGFTYYRGAQLVRPQKWGKGPLSAALICAEAQGPVLFDGWDADGEPVGRPWATPLIQVTAVSESQTDNVYSALMPMIELGALHAEVEDTGLGRINLPGGGKIEPVTASGRSRLGQRVTFINQDQTESWLESNRGVALADNQRRNIAGMGGRWLSTPNAWDLTEDSVAQYTAEHERGGVYHDDVEPPENLSIRDKVERRRALKIVYGDAIAGTRDGKAGGVRPWINPDPIEAMILALLERDPAQAERWFLNRKRTPESAAFDTTRWAEKADPTYVVAPDALVVLAVDGARFRDALAVVATEVETGFQWPIGIWERPDDASDQYEHPFDEVEGAIGDAMERYTVWRVYVDPQHIDSLMERLQRTWTERVVMPWETNRPKPIAWAVRRFAEDVGAGAVSNDGNTDHARHVGNSRRQKLTVRDDKGLLMHTIAKDFPQSSRKMDAGMASVLSWEARGDAIAADAAGGASREAIFI